MSRYYVGRLEEFKPDVRKFVTIADREVAVLAVNGRIVAFENRCPHSGGPVGEGAVIGRVEAVLDEGKRLVCEKFSDIDMQIVCPWHGWAFDVATGAFAGDGTILLKKYDTVTEDDNVYLVHSGAR